ncbi:MAG: tripartite tricarboxylate transporter substrate binding protein [Pseudomonadota bacterium]
MRTKPVKRRGVAAFLWLAAAALAAVCGATAAQTYPMKPIRFVLQHAPGGFGDITARLVAQKMSASMGQQVIIDNRPSSGAIVAANMVAKAEPDGYTLLLTGSGTAASASLFKSLPYDVLKDFEQVSTMGFAELVLVTAPDSKFRSVADVLAFARQNPGKLNIGSNNIGSTQNLAAELFKSMAGIDAQVVPFKASSGLIAAVRGNEIQVAFEFLAPVIQLIKGNALKALAVGASQRFAGLPGTPTVAESGVPGYQASSWNGVSVPARTPRPIVDRLYKEFAAAVNAPDVKQKLQEMGIDAKAYTPAETRKLMISDIAKWKAVIERAKIPRQ